MAHGGARVGAGAKKGSKKKPSQKKALIEAIAKEKGKTPLEVMLEVMNYFLNKAENENDALLKNTYLRSANDSAKDAAPYVHSRMPQAVNVGGNITLVFEDARDKKL